MGDQLVAREGADGEQVQGDVEDQPRRLRRLATVSPVLRSACPDT